MILPQEKGNEGVEACLYGTDRGVFGAFLGGTNELLELLSVLILTYSHLFVLALPFRGQTGMKLRNDFF